MKILIWVAIVSFAVTITIDIFDGPNNTPIIHRAFFSESNGE